MHRTHFTIVPALLPLLILLTIFSFVPTGAAGAQAGSTEVEPLSTPEPNAGLSQNISSEVIQAIEQAIEVERDFVLGLLVNDVAIENVQVSTEDTWASAWLVFTDPGTGKALPAEPGLALVMRENSAWQAILPSDSRWPDAVKNAPDEILSSELKTAWLEIYTESKQPLSTNALGGYLLPWAAGQTAWLSQSVLHDKYTPSGSAHYAFDFYIPQTMFRIYAAKAGKVWRVRWDVPNNTHDNAGNFIVLEDTSTVPTTYQLYLHLAQNSVPNDLRVTGAPVQQGQFIGYADNTGVSTGHHLHFMVHTNPNSYWGQSIDITFDDVDINGGRPRRNDSIYSDKPYCWPTDVCNAFRSNYVSGNIIKDDITAPYGSILKPDLGQTVESSTVTVSAIADDSGSGLASARILANYGSSWKPIGGLFTTTSFSYSWDMCSSVVPDGPVSLALELEDKEGNISLDLPGLTHFTKQFACPPPIPPCTPTGNQVALFAGENFSGSCVVLGSGDYPTSASFGAIGDDNISSIKVGSNILATLFTDASLTGRGETLASNDSNLDDNAVGSNRASSLRVQSRSSLPLKPTVLVAPLNGATLPGGASISLSWRDQGGATQFQVQLQGPSTTTNSDWLTRTTWRLNGMQLDPGTYTWKVRARNCAETACQTGWSPVSTFTITSLAAPAATAATPFLDNIEGGTNGWSYTGLWNRLYDSNHAHSASYSWYYGSKTSGDYKDGTPNAGDLTSRPINIPSGNYRLSFWYSYNTEGPGIHWDKRWVQISENGGPFKDVFQLHDDAPDQWLNPVFDLSEYSGKTVQVRLHFETLDSAFNYYPGWYIDDFEIAQYVPPSCSDSNNTPGQAMLISYSETKSDSICPSGDVDYFKFNAAAGDRIAIDIDSTGSKPPADLDLFLLLLDQDGQSVLAVQDDEVAPLLKDPHLGYVLPGSGTYFLKVRLNAYPAGGGTEYSYNIKLLKDASAPSLGFTNPIDHAVLPDQSFPINVSASDSDSGMSHIAFYYHTADWLSGVWTLIGEDWDGSNGWTISFDPGQVSTTTGMALYAYAFDWAGNWTGAGAWYLNQPMSFVYLPVVHKKP